MTFQPRQPLGGGSDPERVQIRHDGTLTGPRQALSVPEAQGLPNYPLDFFPIGVWQPDLPQFQTWADRGINTFVAHQRSGSDEVDWVNEAGALGMKQIRHPHTGKDLYNDAADPNLLAWLHHDEPDLGGTTSPTPAEMAADRAAWYAVAPHVPAMLNFSGGDVRNALSTSARTDTYRAWMNACDWMAHDLYPVTGWNQPLWHDHRYFKPTMNQQVNDSLRGLLAGAGTVNKPVMNFIECCDQRLPWVPPGANPSTAQQGAHLWDAIINGARGICYFTIAFQPFVFDNMTPEQVDRMVADNALIKQLEPWLLGTRTYVPLTTPFQRAVFTRPSDGTTKTLTINQSDAAATLSGVSYTAYELKVT